MGIAFDLSVRHQVVAANAHYYKTQTDERYIDRTLQHHDLIYLIDGGWSIAGIRAGTGRRAAARRQTAPLYAPAVPPGDEDVLHPRDQPSAGQR